MLNNRDIQRLLTAVGYYNAGIDGDFGPKSWTAVEKILQRNAPHVLGWSKARQKIAAAQVILDKAGYEPGNIDGYYGNNTREAFNAWDYFQSHGKREELPGRMVVSGKGGGPWPSQKNVPTFFGAPGAPACTSGKVVLPIPFRIAWNTSQKVAQFSCHEKVADALTAIFGNAYAHYGEKDFTALRLNVFGGCYNYRNMRGGSSLSMHSWGIAVDLDPDNNQLRWGRDRAAFAKSVYDPFWRIVEAHGGVSLGRARNYDWMHFQFATL